MGKWFRKNKKIFAMVIAIILALLLLVSPVAIAFM